MRSSFLWQCFILKMNVYVAPKALHTGFPKASKRTSFGSSIRRLSHSPSPLNSASARSRDTVLHIGRLRALLQPAAVNLRGHRVVGREMFTRVSANECESGQLGGGERERV